MTYDLTCSLAHFLEQTLKRVSAEVLLGMLQSIQAVVWLSDVQPSRTKSNMHALNVLGKFFNNSSTISA